MKFLIFLFFATTALAASRYQSLEEEEAAAFINLIDVRRGIWMNKAGLAGWAYDTNVTEENSQASVEIDLQSSKFVKESWAEIIKYDWKNFKDEELKRKFYLYSVLGVDALPEDQLQELLKSVSSMKSHYAKTTVCDFNNKTKCDLALEPEITEVFEKSQDPEELKHIWTEWHDKAGSPMKKDYEKYVELSNIGAQLNNISNYADLWLEIYETEGFEQDMKDILDEIKPLYLQMHAYVRKKLWDKYGDKVLSRKGPIPAHLLGNPWAQTWTNIESFTKPFPNKKPIDITPNLIAQNYTALKIFQTSEEFFTSLGMPQMTDTFWKKSIIEKPTDGREFVCHATAYDFADGEDFRIKMCTAINENDFTTVHHEMGHIEYYQVYSHQPRIFRGGANPGFHEAIGDTIALSVSSRKHLKKIGLLTEVENDDEADINALYRMGLEKITFLPFGWMLDNYRYEIFRGQTKPSEYNCKFWAMREDVQGVEPPVKRTEANFDAGAKYHVPADVEYMRYFVSFVVQFQFHRSLCEKAGEYAPGRRLIDCDFYQSKEAGSALMKMLELGQSKPWPDALEQLTGERKINPKALLDYFQPLYDFLKKENEKTGELIGWEKSKIDYCGASQNVHNAPRN